MSETTLTTADGAELVLTLDEAGLLHVYKTGIEIGSVSTAQEVIVPPPEPAAEPRFVQSEFEEPFVPEESDDAAEQES